MKQIIQNETRNVYNQEKKTDLFGMAYMEDIKDYIEQNYAVEVLFLVVTGSHMWNLATPESDLDVRGFYIKPTEQILSLYKGRDTIEANKIMGKEIDLQFYEIEKALHLLLGNNGNITEMMLAPTIFYQKKHIDFQGLARRSLCRKLKNYYAGYATSQRKRAAEKRGGKALTYTYREIMAGIWLMRTGKIIFDFSVLKRKFEQFYGWRSSLLDWSMVNKNASVEEDVWEQFMKEWEQLNLMLNDEEGRSILPKEVDNYSELNELLLDLRKNTY
jgi:predicted nucleotidyltransferase